MGRWAENPFRADLVTRLQAAESTTRYVRQHPESGGGWEQGCVPDRVTPPVLLQGRHLVADVTDRGVALYPLGLAGRFHLDVDFAVPGGAHTSPLAGPDPQRRLVTRVGEAVLAGTGWRVTTRVSPDEPIVEIRYDADRAGPVVPRVRWVPGAVESAGDDGVWLRPASFAQDPVIERNNSTAPDPLPLPDRPTAGVGIVVVTPPAAAPATDPDGAVAATPAFDPDRPAAATDGIAAAVSATDPDGSAAGTEPLLLVTGAYRPGEVECRTLPARTAATVTVLVVVTGTAAAFHAAVRRWHDRRRAADGYWAGVTGRLHLDTPDPAITRQVPFSVHHSLFSRAYTTGGREIFLHGRRDRGYADTSHLHQSYQMHLPALAAGEGASVRDELLAHAALQRPDGWIEAAPRPGDGWSRYVGRYTGAHLLLGVHRYLSWTGDRSLLDEPCAGPFDPVPRTFAERVRRAAEDLAGHRARGLVAPCGWADAWNPAVRAQGQISAAAVAGLRAYAEVLAAGGDAAGARRYGTVADDIAGAVRDLLYDPATGLVAEHLFDDVVAGGDEQDFWAHTQIWARLAGLVPDTRGLDLVARECLGRGLAVAPESSFDRAYVAESTDDVRSLPLNSTATWLLARWPELTHLYALARIEAGDPCAALDAVRSQLPEVLHGLDPVCPPYYYAEKYLHPGTRPWLCTWAGDPSLIEVVLTGFLGVRPAPDGSLRVRPALPAAWRGRSLTAAFRLRDRAYRLELRPDTDPGVLIVDGRAGSPDAPVEPGPGTDPRVPVVLRMRS